MAQANQLPIAGGPAKAPGWDRVLGEGIDKPGSLAEKAEAAFNDAKKGSSLVVKASPLHSVDEKAISEADAIMPSYSNSPAANERKPTPNKNFGSAKTIEEIEVSDILDFDQPKFNGDLKPPPGQFYKPGVNDRDLSGGKGWNMQIDEPIQQMQAMPDVSGPGEQLQNGPTKRWYKPSTWNQNQKGKQAPNNNANAPKSVTEEPTSMQSFGPDIQRIGSSSPSGDKYSGEKHFSGEHKSPGRRRPRPQPAQEMEPVAVDCGFMDCPGAIIDTPAPAALAPAPKAVSNPKHHSGGVDKAAFAAEERAERKAAAEAEKTSAARGKVGELEARKKAAIAAEDFLEANRIKGEIDKLKAEASSAGSPAPVANASAVQSFSAAPVREDAEVKQFHSPQGMQFHSPQPMARDRSAEAPPRQPAATDAGGNAGGWNLQVEEPAQAAPTVSEEPVRKRFWRPFGGDKKKQEQGPLQNEVSGFEDAS
jgi:hypothetical protein